MTFILCWPPEPEEWWWGIQWIEPSWALHLQRNEDEWWQQPRVSRVTRGVTCDTSALCTAVCTDWIIRCTSRCCCGQLVRLWSCSHAACLIVATPSLSLSHYATVPFQHPNLSIIHHTFKNIYIISTLHWKLPSSSSVDYIGQCVCWLWGDGWWWWGGRVIRLIHNTPPPA